MGYFSVPRETTASEVAAELGISKSAFLERLRRGQDGLFAQVFELG
jgi:predicted DNA binding protein